jgi:hypothetical protein
MTTAIFNLATRIRTAFPLATVGVDPPLHDCGKYHIDVRLGDRLVTIEWSEQLGIGVSLVLDAALDGGPDFRLPDSDGAFRIVKLLLLEAQDADFGRDLGSWTAETPEAIAYEDLAVAERESRAPRRRAA